MTSIVIVGLGAVVVLILVVVLAAMHYLKADDGDDFDVLPDERLGEATGHDRRTGFRRPVRDAHTAGRAMTGETRRADRGDVQRGGRGYGERPGRRDPRDRGPRDYADDPDPAGARGGHLAAAGHDDRHGPERAAQRRQDGLPAVRPRQARGKRADDDGDWPSTDWDELSDVDYWAQVASDKPLTTTAQPAGHARQARSGQNRGADARQAPSARPGPAPQRDPAPRLPVRGQRRPAAAPQPAMRQPEFSPAPVATSRAQADAGQWLPGAPPGQRPDARAGVPQPRPDSLPQPRPDLLPQPRPDSLPQPRPDLLPQPRADSPPRARPDSLPHSRPGSRPGSRQAEPSLAVLAGLGSPPQPVIADDDPLTSPSFPRIPADDSRSYRNQSAASGPHSRASYDALTGRPADYAPAAGQPNGYGSAGQPDSAAGQGGGYRRAAAEGTNPQPYRRAPSAMPPEAASYPGPGNHPAASPAAGGHLAGPLPAARTALPAQSPVPRAAANPYGSYVSAPRHSGPPNSAADLPGGGIPARYDGYAAGPDSGQRDAGYPPPGSGGQIPPPPSAGPGNGWYPGSPAGFGAGYSDIAAPSAAPGSGEPGYQNGNARAGVPGYPNGHDPAGYLPSGYPDGQLDAAGYAGQDPYGRDPYGGYPGYGTER